MKISISATNPCHLFDLAKALHRRGHLGQYYSGYPSWKLKPPRGFPLRTGSSRTLLTYGCLRLPPGFRPASHRLFRWQDDGFDRAVARLLHADRGTSFHAMPGQALNSFKAAREQGVATILNHASGPVRHQLALVAEEYRRVGLPLEQHHGFDAGYFRREDAEYELAERHCVASRVVRNQLLQAGVASEKIWVVPYAADPEKFFPNPPSSTRDGGKIVFAGQISLRKGLRVAFAAMEKACASKPVTLHLYGTVASEMRSTLASVADRPWLKHHGPVSQTELGRIFRHAGMLVLPSWEEAFGLVVSQALACALPCIVSDRVGAADLIEHRRNGSIVRAGDDDALAAEIIWWAENRHVFESQSQSWDDCAAQLVALTERDIG